MKKIVILFLIFVISANLFACTNKTNSEAKEKVLSKEEMLAQAAEIDMRSICSESEDNLAYAKNKYCDKIIKLTGLVESINEDHIVLRRWYGGDYLVDVYLPTEDLIAIKKDYQVTVVGKITEEILEKPDVHDTTNLKFHYQMPIAFFVTNRYKTEGSIKVVNYVPEHSVIRAFFKHNNIDYSLRCIDEIAERNLLPVGYSGIITVESEIRRTNEEVGYNSFHLYECGYRFENVVIIEWE